MINHNNYEEVQHTTLHQTSTRRGECKSLEKQKPFFVEMGGALY